MAADATKQAAAALAEAQELEQAKTDAFIAQQQAIDTLTRILEQQKTATAGPVVYETAPTVQPPNYVLYGAIALLVYFLMRRKK